MITRRPVYLDDLWENCWNGYVVAVWPDHIELAIPYDDQDPAFENTYRVFVLLNHIKNVREARSSLRAQRSGTSLQAGEHRWPSRF